MASHMRPISRTDQLDTPLIVEDLLAQATRRLEAGDRGAARQMLRLAVRIGSGEA